MPFAITSFQIILETTIYAYTSSTRPRMGFLAALRALANSLDTEYDRRIRAASHVKDYGVGGHGLSADDHLQMHPVEAERLQGEGGAHGDLQANAGPQVDRGQGTGNRGQTSE
jgi:hypothetical protein